MQKIGMFFCRHTTVDFPPLPNLTLSRNLSEGYLSELADPKKQPCNLCRQISGANFKRFQFRSISCTFCILPYLCPPPRYWLFSGIKASQQQQNDFWIINQSGSDINLSVFSSLGRSKLFLPNALLLRCILIRKVWARSCCCSSAGGGSWINSRGGRRWFANSIAHIDLIQLNCNCHCSCLSYSTGGDAAQVL